MRATIRRRGRGRERPSEGLWLRLGWSRAAAAALRSADQLPRATRRPQLRRFRGIGLRLCGLLRVRFAEPTAVAAAAVATTITASALTTAAVAATTLSATAVAAALTATSAHTARYDCLAG